MWRVIGFPEDESDPEFVVWHLLAERDDGRIQSVRVKVDRLSFAEHQGPVEGNASKWAQEVIQSQGKLLIELTEVETLPPAYVFWYWRIRRRMGVTFNCVTRHVPKGHGGRLGHPYGLAVCSRLHP